MPPLLVDLDVASNQRAWPIHVGRSLDAECVHSPGLSTVIDIDREGLRGRAGRPDHRSHTRKRGVVASRCRRARSAGAADLQGINRLGLYPYISLMVVVLQVPGRRTALRDESEGGLSVGVGQTGNQSGERYKIPKRREDGIAVDLAPTSGLPGSRRAACPHRNGSGEPGGEVSIPNHLLTRPTWI